MLGSGGGCAATSPEGVLISNFCLSAAMRLPFCCRTCACARQKIIRYMCCLCVYRGLPHSTQGRQTKHIPRPHLVPPQPAKTGRTDLPLCSPLRMQRPFA